jgi:ubiquinone/menaquinone biosynthesis C-methylase UbiE
MRQALPLLFLLFAACGAPAIHEAPVREGLNERFLDPGLDVERFEMAFEGESREVWRERAAIQGLLGLKPGMAVADIGAGTGLFTFPMAQAVGLEGRVYAVEISPVFLENLTAQAQQRKTPQVQTVLCPEDDSGLPANTIDRAFVCDTYHHFTYPLTTTGSILRALRPGGQLLVVDFERIEGVSRDWILGHVRASKETVRAEIEQAGFRFLREIQVKGLEENYCLLFERP